MSSTSKRGNNYSGWSANCLDLSGKEDIDDADEFIRRAHFAHSTLTDGISAIGCLLANADESDFSSNDTLGDLGQFIEDIGGLIDAFESISYDVALRDNTYYLIRHSTKKGSLYD